ncbi:MAG: hypothetical protein IKO56_10960 [Alphaproteobacteria bacterium]|nr:hypothetical protein [Alphaproteobacteria bacterium]
MKNVTTIEQSKMLMEFGLDPKTADMSYRWTYCKIQNGNPKEDWLLQPYPMDDNQPDEEIPCWSTGALIELLPSEIWKDKTMYPLIIVKRSDCYCVEYNANIIPLIGFAKPTLIEALISVYLWVSESGYMEKTEQQNYSVCMKK